MWSQRFGPTKLMFPLIFAANHRTMYDAIGANATILLQFRPRMVLGYDTGSPEIVWNDREWNLFPGVPHVHTDQGGAGAPKRSATLMDVEPHAYSVAQIPDWIRQCTAPVPTVYADRNDAGNALARGYKGPLALAWPDWQGESLPGAPGQVVAVQNVFQTDYDAWTVLDPYWPSKPPVRGNKMISGTLMPQEADFAPFPAGVFSQIQLYHDFTAAGNPVPVRVAIHSLTGGYVTILDPYEIQDNVPHVIKFVHGDVDGVSMVNESTTESVGWTIS